MTQTYRWNVADHAAGYDAAAEAIHPYYLEIQDTILERIDRPADADFLLLDLGGGSGRLAARFLERWPRARAVVVDQSEAFLELARARMEPFAGRGSCQVARLQDDWASQLPEAPNVITSMSAIHHLLGPEKQQLYRQAYRALAPGGKFLNGDEIRDADDDVYRGRLLQWGEHLRELVRSGRVHEVMGPMFEKWYDRNINRFGEPRTSGDDCHETTAAHLEYLANCGFASVATPWEKDMWVVLEGVK